jgi:hypothetical protein
MPKRRVKKELRLYPVGKEDLRVLPATPARRIACSVILQGVATRIENQLASERQRLALKLERAHQASELYRTLVDTQLKALAK